MARVIEKIIFTKKEIAKAARSKRTIVQQKSKVQSNKKQYKRNKQWTESHE